MALPAAMALSGLNEEYFSDGLNDVFNHGALLLKSPSLSSMASASSEDGYSQESGFSSMSSEASSVVKNLAPFFNMLFNSRVHVKNVNAAPTPPPSPVETTPAQPQPLQIKYHKRNILDLAANIKWKWDFQPAEFQSDAHYFFENRSQYTRVLGAQIPEHVNVKCSHEECSFEEPRYE